MMGIWLDSNGIIRIDEVNVDHGVIHPSYSITLKSTMKIIAKIEWDYLVDLYMFTTIPGSVWSADNLKYIVENIYYLNTTHTKKAHVPI